MKLRGSSSGSAANSSAAAASLMPRRVATASRTLVRVRSQLSTSSRGILRSRAPNSVVASLLRTTRASATLAALRSRSVKRRKSAEAPGSSGYASGNSRLSTGSSNGPGSSGSPSRSLTISSNASSALDSVAKPSGSPSEINSISCMIKEASSSTSYALSCVTIMPRLRWNFFIALRISDSRNSDRAPLSWTSERADTLFVGERVRKAAASQRDPRRASLASEAIQCGSLVRFVEGGPEAIFMHGCAIALHRFARAIGDDRLARSVHLQHQFLGLGLGVVEVSHEHVGHVGHEVDRVVPDNGDPRCLSQGFIDWALGDRGSTCWRQALPVGVRHTNHSCNEPEGFAHRAPYSPPTQV